ncbi:plasmid partitioning protein RepB [Sulfitobacter pontiacus]|jgi:ParB family transcriptional regulator, chromosome partitioning protein|uniref:plasmid partitioning protein RepB n=1 Tax=Sulfitobacter pontiacus TaxID=60137 RepID=UPI00182C68A3|nr:plasmid partitioning protein RepB [Sulfitobacter pontiacus]GLO80266.1 plasmid partitioning protein RepB [Sulfitobacter pontiacus]
MAMGKNKTGIMAAITAAAETANSPKEGGSDRAHRSLPKGTIGSVRAGLGGIQEIDTKLILAWGPKDRLDVELTAVNSEDPTTSIRELASSIKEAGQQVPVLLRPASERDGFFEVIYGQRRILACRYLEIPVRALIRTLDDTDALMAKGLENASRAELSFYERARFAQAILDQSYSRSDVCQALAISKNSLSQLERINRLVPSMVGEAIGAAPSAGRPKWMTLATAFEKGTTNEQEALLVLSNCSTEMTSDDRLDLVLREMSKRGTRERSIVERSPVPGVSIKANRSALSVSVKRTGDSEQFAAWLDESLDQIIRDSFERFQSENREG